MEKPWFSPAELAPIAGVSESTLKRWVDIGHLRAEKTAGGHRKIAAADLIAFLRSRGRSVPSLEGLTAMAGVTSARRSRTLTPGTLADLLIRGDVPAARSLLAGQFQSGRELVELADELVAPAMSQIGLWWADSTVDVYQEHLATLRAWGILLDLKNLLPVPREDAPLAIGAVPEGDPYLLPSLMAEIALAELGWRTMNIGPNTPIGSLQEAMAAHAPRMVWLSVTSRSPHPSFFEGYPRVFEAAQSQGIPVALGGQGVTPALRDRLVASAFGTRLAHLKAFARAITR